MLYIGDLPGPTAEEIQALAAEAPGSVWYVVGEPNRREGYAGDQVAEQLHDLYTQIKTADPTALITSPSVLNWEFTCRRRDAGTPEDHGCSWDYSGLEWVEDFRSEYLSRYGEEPPVDIWAIDAYPLDWLNLPTVNAQIPIDQIAGMREYLDSTTAHQGKPIWITELSLHWGFNCPDPDNWPLGCFVFSDGKIGPPPEAVYDEGAVIQYLNTVLDWLEANSTALNIEKWFLYTSYADLRTPTPFGFAGLSLFDNASPGANLTPVGELIRDRISE